MTMRVWSRRGLFLALVLSAPGSSATARASQANRELAFQLVAPRFGAFETTDVGFGGRLSYLLRPYFALEGELTFFPANLTEEQPFSDRRVEGLFGVKVGPRFEKFGVFGRLRPGFFRFGKAPEPLACILIFPPPLACELSSGRTVWVMDLGGGIELFPHPRTVLRLDLGDSLLRYPGPVLGPDGKAYLDGSFWSHNLRVAVGGGFRF